MSELCTYTLYQTKKCRDYKCICSSSKDIAHIKLFHFNRTDNWMTFYRTLLLLTFSRNSTDRTPLLIILSRTRSAICSKLPASISSMTVPFKRRLLNSKSECSDKVATWGLLHLLPPSSTSSSNLIHLRILYLRIIFVYMIYPCL